MSNDGCGRGLFLDRIGARPCWTCEHFSPPAICGGSHAICAHPNYPGVVPRPRAGCAFWTRAIGLDELDAEDCDRLAHQFARPTKYTVIGS